MLFMFILRKLTCHGPVKHRELLYKRRSHRDRIPTKWAGLEECRSVRTLPSSLLNICSSTPLPTRRTCWSRTFLYQAEHTSAASQRGRRFTLQLLAFRGRIHKASRSSCLSLDGPGLKVKLLRARNVNLQLAFSCLLICCRHEVLQLLRNLPIVGQLKALSV